MTEADIFMLRREGISVDDDNGPASDDFIQSDYVFPPPSSLTFGFHGVDLWCQSGPVGRAKLKMTPIPRI